MTGRVRVTALLAVLVAGCGLVADPPTSAGGASVPTDALATRVERIVDGDTLVVADLDTRVRLIGIDTPETPRGGEPDCYGREATEHLEILVPPGTDVHVAFDVERTDRYDRPLGYLYRDADGTFVNLAMIADGYAMVLTVPPNVAHEDVFTAAQRAARAAGLGLWSACP